jgi:16S rRNA (guanine527-N7)-methyltransferase
LCRPEIAVTLAESQGKKAAFLQEALRTLELPGQVFAGRAEGIGKTFDCVAMRAVDRMVDAVGAAGELVARDGWLILMATGAELPQLQRAAMAFRWMEPIKLPLSEDRVVALGRRTK